MDRQDNLRNRVASTTIRRTYNGGVDSLYDYATHYSYDVTGNVKTLIQDIKELQVYNHRFKRMDYNYDQLSGKVNAVFYQRDSVDQFAHFYKYDADNRLTEVSTSTQINTYYRASSQSIWRFIEATYDYYKHGPLARTELGTMRVQGVDYAYTLQGWLKGVNSVMLTSSADMGKDGLSTNASRKYVGRDAMGFVLNYYTNDYKAPAATFDPDSAAATKSAYYNAGQQLFNGNIRSMTVAIKKFGNANGYVYGYDQLNRIKKMDTWNTTTAGGVPFTWTLKTAYNERITYDPNGNIKTYTRNQQAGTLMDNLAYNYYTGTNRLSQVTDGVAAASFTTDIDNQANTSNYAYDGVGNLISDASESLAVTWSPYGKVLDATRTGIKTLYGYDAMQNRVVKTFIQATDTTRSFYIRDAQGNTMAVYTRRLDTVKWTEQHLYGSSRLGIWEPNQRLTPSVDTTKKWQIREGQKRYELTNHLGNVLVTVNDRRKGTDTNADTFFDVYDGVEITATDYYPFGLEMPGRAFQATSYRYGFNGKENDRTSWSGTQLVQDYGFRLYNPAIAKFLSVDPLAASYPFYTPYQFAGNMPLIAIDLDGAEPLITNQVDVVGTYNVYWQNYSKKIKPTANSDRTYSVFKANFNSMSRYTGRTVIALKADLDVDNDNSKTRTGGPQLTETSFKFEGRSINSDDVSFFVKPTQGKIGKDLKNNGVKLGDLAIAFRVSENGELRSSIGIIADNGPKGMTGEGSTNAARDLGLSTNPNTGGSAQNDVFFFFFPGTKGATPF